MDTLPILSRFLSSINLFSNVRDLVILTLHFGHLFAFGAVCKARGRRLPAGWGDHVKLN